LDRLHLLATSRGVSCIGREVVPANQ
jgi:hypothetical protein